MIYDLIEYVLENGEKKEREMAKFAGADMDKLEAELAAKDLQIIRLETALKFYAEPRRYYGPNQKELIDGDPFQPANFPYLWDVTRDDGKIARAALLKG